MTQCRFNPMILAIAFAVLGMTLSSCNTVESHGSSEAVVPEAIAKGESEGSETPPDSQASEGIANAEVASIEGGSESSSGAESSSPNSQTLSTDPKAAAAKGKEPQKTQTADIRIDETVCGAGGQEAYFETKVQEIYICKNAEGALTYIATPKKKGNSFFLPAQKIQQGNVVGYAAMDETQTYIVTPGGFQRQDNGKPTQSEKVIRRQLAEE